MHKSIPGKFRLIQELSFPKSKSVNLGIPKELSTVHYDGIESVINLIKQFGRGF